MPGPTYLLSWVPGWESRSPIPNVCGEHGDPQRVCVQILNSEMPVWSKGSLINVGEIKLSEVDVLSFLIWSCD